jgi:hypothetical protein
VPVVDLRNGQLLVSSGTANITYLDKRILLDVILKSSQLKMQHWWESIEDDSLPGILQTVSLRLVLVLAIQSLDLHVVLERVSQVLDTLDGELDVCSHCQQVALDQIRHAP